ncbi:MAG: hypothetical protein Q4C70_12145 [Planctomycetia bacterium]|nr:hypothetical protein [Planctomycetia bacterium]
MNTRLTPSVAVKLLKTPMFRVFWGVFTLFFTLFFTGFSSTLLFGSEEEEKVTRTAQESSALVSVTSRASNNAVKYGLEWLVRHQLPDGSWSFNHSVADPTQCTCGNPGTYAECKNYATALALLPFIGCGMTHEENEYHPHSYNEHIHAGLKFLLSSAEKVPNHPSGASLYQDEGAMYAHGLGTLCLTELYTMTKDESLCLPARSVKNYIIYTQDPISGGWRYEIPREIPSETEEDAITTSLQLITLRSAKIASLYVNPQCIAKGMNFLDSVQLDGGATYGYAKPGKDPTCTAIGLLCRMHYGWDRNNPALVKGIEYLSDLGPNSDIFYNYYATQLLRHYGGEHWKKWHEKMRRQLITTQIKEEGHAKGS